MRWKDLIGRPCRAPEGGPGGGTEGAPGGGTEGGPGGGDWLGGLPEDVRGHPEIAKFKDKGIEDLAKEHINVQALIGKKGVILPGENASDEDWAKFYGAIGRPDAPDGYEFKETDTTDKDLVGWLRETAHKHGIPKAAAEGLYADWNALQAKNREEVANATKAYGEALRSELGSQFDAKMAAADEAFKALLPTDGDRAIAANLKLADGTYVLDHPVLAKAFIAAHGLVGEDGDLRRPGRPFLQGVLNTPAGAKAEIDRLRGEAAKDDKHPLTNEKHPEYQAMQDRMTALYKVAYPEGSEHA